MALKKIIGLALVAGSLTACVGEDKGRDGFLDRKDLSTLEAGIWIDPNGCDHWIVDDGLEGYLSQRLDKYGKPVCSGTAPPTTATGPFKEGTWVPDIL